MIKLELSLEEARTIYRNLKNHFIQMDDQRVVYDFVHKLDQLILDQEVQMTPSANAKRDMDK